ncbi:MAG: outer membrane protein assembly factor BamA [Thiotrichales bacterium]|nr:outer membrane protein assembly factor BamA [Thiotrichales bacterium]
MTSREGAPHDNALRDYRQAVVNLARLRIAVITFVLCAAVRAAVAVDAFVVQDIRLEGLQRITAGTVFNYLPIKVGDTVDGARTAGALRALFGTGFFRDVRLERDGETLVVSVIERPSIGSIEFSGNEDLKTEDLLSALEQSGFAQGRVFNRSTFDQVKQELHRTYFAAGKYGARITGTVTPLERNRVAVKFDIREGVVAKIRQINIVGNTAFDDDDLLDDFELDATGFFSFITRSNRYSKPKLAADLETLRSFYLDQGFINFNIDSTQVSISPDKADVYITINITEGGRYLVRDVYLQGALLVPEAELFDLVTVVQDGVFSRKDVTETARRIGDRLGDEGYSFANVNAVPEIDDAENRVDLTFFVDPGNRVYVRRINFRGNAKTRDEVLRREMRQMESGWISTEAIERSRVRLNRLGFFESVSVETPAVPGTSDQVDVDFTVVERPSGNLLLGVGYSSSEGPVFDTSITDENIFGTGNRLSASLDTSDVSRDISVSWLNPYWTVDGVSRGFDAYMRRTDASEANLADYDLDRIGAGMTFGVPVSESTRVNVGFNLEQTEFRLGSSPSDELNRFYTESGGRFLTLLVTGAWAKDTRNSRFLPTSGSLSRLSAEFAAPGSELTYYKLFARHQRLFPLPGDFAFMLEGEVAYGDGFGGTDNLPLTENFFAGGLRSVRGFRANTLGPRDSLGEPLGGSLKTVGTAELILPLPFAKNSSTFRITTFLDTGNVYGPDEDFDFDTLRFSTGLAAVWLSPVGPMTVSIARPLRSETDDRTQRFQLTLGTSF